MRAHVVRAGVIVGLGCGLGLGWNALSGRGLVLSRNVLIREGDEIVGVAEAKKRLEQGALFLDARPEAFYRMSHVRGSLPLPEEDFDAAFVRLESRLRATLDIIVYCSGFGCEASHDVARKLKERGIPAAILHDGWPAWEEARYPIREGPEP